MNTYEIVLADRDVLRGRVAELEANVEKAIVTVCALTGIERCDGCFFGEAGHVHLPDADEIAHIRDARLSTALAENARLREIAERGEVLANYILSNPQGAKGMGEEPHRIWMEYQRLAYSVALLASPDVSALAGGEARNG